MAPSTTYSPADLAELVLRNGHGYTSGWYDDGTPESGPSGGPVWGVRWGTLHLHMRGYTSGGTPDGVMLESTRAQRLPAEYGGGYGYPVVCHYLRDAELAQRVRTVAQGGHWVPADAEAAALDRDLREPERRACCVRHEAGACTIGCPYSYDPQRVPGWLRRLLEDDVPLDDVRSAALYCADRYHRELLAERLRQLQAAPAVQQAGTPGTSPAAHAANGDPYPPHHYGRCDLCGEPLSGEIAEMAKPGRGVVVCHAQCGLAGGWEVA